MLAGKDNLTGLAVEAARKALEMAKVDPDDLDLILMCLCQCMKDGMVF